MQEESGYHILGLLGSGGMGAVYEAVHRPSGLRVAVKLVPPAEDDAGLLRQLVNEATAAARLRHPNIVELLDVGRDERGGLFLVMELVDGHDLEAWVWRWPGWPQLVGAVCAVLDGLAAAHAQRVVHGDLKPANVLWARDGSVKIADFGIAHVVDPLRGASAREGLHGTPAYMAPEQFERNGDIGPWTDLYAVGALLAHLVTGRVPFGATTLAEILAAKFDRPLLLEPRVSLPPALAALIVELLRPEPRARPRFAAEVRDRLRTLGPLVDDAVEPMLDERVSAPTLVADEPITKMRVDGTVDLDPGADVPRAARDSGSTGPTLQLERLWTAPSLPAVAAAPGASLLHLRALPLIGRHEEMALAHKLKGEVLEGGGARLLVLLGEPGVGKSRIARQQLAEVEQRGEMEGIAGGYEPSTASLGGGLLRAVSTLLGGHARTEPSTSWRWLLDGNDAPFDERRMTQWLSQAGDALPSDVVVDLAEAALLAAARKRPVFLWLDDFGWARDGAHELVRRLLEHPTAPLFIIATLRSGTADHPAVSGVLAWLAAHPRARFHTVRRLEAAQRSELVQAVAPVAPDVARALGKLLDETPLTIEQLVKDWVDRGLLVPSEHGLSPARGTVADLIALRPVAAIVAHRLEMFFGSFFDDAPRAEAVLLCAALIGSHFADATLRLAAGTKVDDVLDRALFHGILRVEPVNAYRFDHQLIRDGLLERLTRRPDAAQLSGAVADSLYAAYGRARPDILASGAVLLRSAGRQAEADAAIEQAVDQCAQAGVHDRAAELIAMAEVWLEQDGAGEHDPRRASLSFRLARLYYFQSRYAEARVYAARAWTVWDALGDEMGRANVRFVESSLDFYQDRFARAARMAHEVLAAASLDDPARAELGHLALHRLAEIEALRGDAHTALELFDRARAYARASTKPWREHLLTLSRTEILATQAHGEALHGSVALVLEAALADGNEMLAREALDTRARIHARSGAFERARLHVEERLGEVEAQNDAWRGTALLLLEALAAAALDPPDAAAAAARRFLDAYRTVPHDEPFSWWAMREVARRLAASGAHEASEEIAQTLNRRQEAVRRAFEQDSDRG